MNHETKGGKLSLPQYEKLGKVMQPGKGHIADWVNRYTLSLFPQSIGTTGIRVLPANPYRTYLFIQNNSAGTIFINFGTNATLISGIQIAAGGNYIQEGGAPAGAFVSPDDVYALGSAANLAIVIGEGLWQSVTI